MLATGAADLELTSDEPDFQTAMDLAEELSHAMVVRLLRLHGARTSGKRAYAPKSEQQNQVVSLGGQTITLTPEQQAAFRAAPRSPRRAAPRSCRPGRAAYSRVISGDLG